MEACGSSMGSIVDLNQSLAIFFFFFFFFCRQVPTAELNAWLKAMTAHRRPPGKVKYITQVR